MANNIQITVFTPSFNRSDLLRKLYVSLCRQTCRNFEWLIVDDGSTDSRSEERRVGKECL